MHPHKADPNGSRCQLLVLDTSSLPKKQNHPCVATEVFPLGHCPTGSPVSILCALSQACYMQLLCLTLYHKSTKLGLWRICREEKARMRRECFSGMCDLRRSGVCLLASDAVARMCSMNCDARMGDGIRSERLGNIPQRGIWARAVPKGTPRKSRISRGARRGEDPLPRFPLS